MTTSINPSDVRARVGIDALNQPGTVARRSIGGCEAFEIASLDLSCMVVPERGGRIVSLRDRTRDHEWMWAPGPRDRLPARPVGSDFASGPLVGADECLPSVGACAVGGLSIPDHGEIWARPWTVDPGDLEHGVLTTRVALDCMPFELERSILLDGPSCHLSYRLRNLSGDALPWLWSWHPLMVLPENARLELSPRPREIRVESGEGVPQGAVGPWPSPFEGACLDRLELGAETASGKLFCGGIERAVLTDLAVGSALEITADPAVLSGMGLWINRGGWNGYRHVAIEPTNVPVETLGEAAQLNGHASI
ncbi:MAG: hypothetical protein AAFU70_12865, partial [Planctomycetota bacterium]